MTPFNGGGPEKAESAEQQNDAGVEAAAEGLDERQIQEVGQRIDEKYSQLQTGIEENNDIVPYFDESGNKFWHLDLQYNENLGKHAENPQVVEAFIDMVTNALFIDPSTQAMYGYEQNPDGSISKKVFARMNENGGYDFEERLDAEGNTIPNGKGGTIKYKSGDRVICSRITVQGWANDLPPAVSAEGMDWQDNDELATARGEYLLNEVAIKLGVDPQFINLEEPRVFSRNDVIPGGISYEDSPGIKLAFEGRGINKIEPQQEEGENIASKAYELGIDPWSDGTGLGSLNNLRSSRGQDLLGGENLRRQYYDAAINQLSGGMFGSMTSGAEYDIVSGSETVMTVSKSADGKRVTVTEGGDETKYIDRGDDYVIITPEGQQYVQSNNYDNMTVRGFTDIARNHARAFLQRPEDTGLAVVERNSGIDGALAGN